VSRRGLARLVGVELRRHLGRLAVGGAGVVLGIAALVFFLGLALGIRDVVLGEVFPVDRIEVEPESRDFDILMFRFALASDTIDQDQLDQLADLPGVRSVYPKMKLVVPAVASGGGSLLGSELQTEVVADGIDPALVLDQGGSAFCWAEFDPTIPCATSRQCPQGSYCGDGVHGRAGECRPYVPVLLSYHLLEMYNGSLRRAYRLPRLNPDVAVGFEFDMAFGASTLQGSASRHVVRERARVVGFSDKAITLGVTLPLAFVRDLNVAFSSSKASAAYHSAIVEVADRAAMPDVLTAVQEMELVVKDRGAERAATLVSVSMVLIAVMGGAIIAIASLSVTHVFLVIVLHRRREIGVLRAVGASKADIAAVILAQAAVVGCAAGALGTSAAVVAARFVDRLAAARIPDFPYKPETFFAFPWWLLMGGVFVAVLACAVGAALPAARAVTKDPAVVLAMP
jgi:putative ABC transport system permease protein